MSNTQLTPEQIEELKGMLTEQMLEESPDIFDMLLASVSLSFDEKKYWIQLYPLMTAEHLQSLRDILTNEREEMERAKGGYDQGVRTLDFNAPVDRSAYEQKREELRAKEEQYAELIEQQGEELLKQLSSLDE